MNFICIGDEETVRGFRLAGISGQVVATATEALAAVDRAASQADCGIILLAECLSSGIHPQIEAIRLERNVPLIVEIPGPDGPVSGRKSLHQLVQEAVGIRVG